MDKGKKGSATSLWHCPELNYFNFMIIFTLCVNDSSLDDLNETSFRELYIRR